MCTGDDSEDIVFWELPSVIYNHCDITSYITDSKDAILQKPFYGGLLKVDKDGY